MPPRAPKFYGAWVDGRFFNPGSFLPKGTTEYLVQAIIPVPADSRRRGGSDFLTIRYTAMVGLPFEDLSEIISQMTYDLLNSDSP